MATVPDQTVKLAFCWRCVAPAVEEAIDTGRVVRVAAHDLLGNPALVVPEPSEGPNHATKLPGYPVRNAAGTESAYVVCGGDS